MPGIGSGPGYYKEDTGQWVQTLSPMEYRNISNGAPAASQPGGGIRLSEPPRLRPGQKAAQYLNDVLGLNGLKQATGGGGLFGGGGFGGGGDGGGGTAFGGGGGAGYPSAGSRIGSIGPIDMTASNAATFGRAKDVAGQTGRSSLDTLRAVLGETGQLGGGAEAQGVRDVVENAAGQTGEVNREMAIQGGRQAFDVARTNQAAGITQRGQDIQAQEAQARLAQEQAQIMFQQQMAKSQQQLDLLRMVLGQAGGGAGSLY